LHRGIIVAIDGPAGSGKSTTARLVAKRLEFRHIDSGALYRAVTVGFLESGTPFSEIDDIMDFLSGVELQIRTESGESVIYLNKRDVTAEIRSPAVTRAVSEVSAHRAVRKVVTEELRKLAGGHNAVVEGRDIGTVVFPEAEWKFFVNAALVVRAGRRLQELQLAGSQVTLEQVERDMATRDTLDSERAVSPLTRAEDAILLDTTTRSIDESVMFIVHMIKQRHNI
jgi:cytidylate kinase